jgi:hypothetical protein
VLTGDTFAVIGHLALTHSDLSGYSLGGRTLIGALVPDPIEPSLPVSAWTRSFAPPVGAGTSAISSRTWGPFHQAFPNGETSRYLRSVRGDLQALLRVETPVDSPVAVLAAIATPVLVVAGAEDHAH